MPSFQDQRRSGERAFDDPSLQSSALQKGAPGKRPLVQAKGGRGLIESAPPRQAIERTGQNPVLARNRPGQVDDMDPGYEADDEREEEPRARAPRRSNEEDIDPGYEADDEREEESQREQASEQGSEQASEDERAAQEEEEEEEEEERAPDEEREVAIERELEEDQDALGQDEAVEDAPPSLDSIPARAKGLAADVALAWSAYRDAYLAFKGASAQKQNLRDSFARNGVKAGWGRSLKLEHVVKRANKKLALLDKWGMRDAHAMRQDALDALAMVDNARQAKEDAKKQLDEAKRALELVLASVEKRLKEERRNLRAEQVLADDQIKRLQKHADALTKRLDTQTRTAVETGDVSGLRQTLAELEALNEHIAAASQTLNKKSTHLADTLEATDQVGETRADQGRMQRLQHHCDMAEFSQARLMNIVAPMTKGPTGSMGLGLSVGVAAGLNGEVFQLGGDLSIKYTANMNVQDDRKFRVAHKLALSPSLKAQIGKAAEAKIEGELFGQKTSVYLDEEHWSAYMAHRIAKVYAACASALRGQEAFRRKVRQEDIDFARRMQVDEKMLAILEHNRVPVNEVMTGGASIGASASAMGLLGAGASHSEQIMSFQDNGNNRTKTGTQAATSLSFTFGPFTLGLTFTEIDGHMNPDNDGSYFNINLSMAGGVKGAVPSGDPPTTQLFAALDEWFSGQGVPTSEAALPEWVQALEEKLGVLQQEFEIPALGHLSDVSAGGSMGREWNFINEEAKGIDPRKWHLQYARFVEGFSAGINGTVPTGQGVDVSFGASLSQQSSFKEKLGTGTVSYLQTVYNGLIARDKRDVAIGARGADMPGQWAAYVKQHRNEICGMLANIANPESFIRSEVSEVGGDLEEDARDAAEAERRQALDEFIALCETSFRGQKPADISSGDFDAAMAHLVTIFDVRTAAAKAGQQWKQKPEKVGSELGFVTVRFDQAPWRGFDLLPGNYRGANLPDPRVWNIATVIDPELGADEVAAQKAWRDGGALATGTRTVRALYDAGFALHLDLGGVRLDIVQPAGEAAVRDKVEAMYRELAGSRLPELLDQDSSAVIDAMMAAIFDKSADFVFPRPT